MKKLLLVVAIAVAVAIGFSLSTLRATVLRGVESISEEIASQSKAALVLGDVSMSFLPMPTVVVRNIEIVRRRDNDADERPSIEVPVLRVHPRLLPLLVGRVSIRSVEAEMPILQLRREPESGDPAALLQAAGIGRLGTAGFPLTITDATLQLRDEARAHPVSMDITDLDARIDADASTGVVRIVGSGQPFGAESRAVFDAELEPGSGRTGGDRLRARAEVEGADPRDVKRLFPLLAGLPSAGPIDATLTAEGFLGETSTESIPADTLDVVVAGSGPFRVFDRAEPLSFDLVVALDDKRVVARDGQAVWGGIEASFAGWLQRGAGGKLSGRMQFEDIDVAAVLADFGVEQRLRPTMKVSGHLKLSGNTREPLLNYEATSDGVTYDAFSGYEVVSSAVALRGAVLASNAVFSISAQPGELTIGRIRLEKPALGARYFRDKFTASALDLAIWGGKSNFSVAYLPLQQQTIEGGGMLESADVAELLEALLPDTGLEMTGDCDAIAKIGFDGRAPWSMGRIGFYDGNLVTGAVGHAALASIAEAVDAPQLLAPTLADVCPETLSADRASYERIEMDYQTRDDGIALRSITMDMPDASLSAEGLIARDDTVAGWGVLTLSERVTREAIAHLGPLIRLVGVDGRLHVPLKLEGTVAKAAISVDERFTHELARAMRGERVAPFATAAPESELVMDLPTLQEQFDRW